MTTPIDHLLDAPDQRTDPPSNTYLTSPVEKIGKSGFWFFAFTLFVRINQPFGEAEYFIFYVGKFCGSPVLFPAALLIISKRKSRG